MNDTIDNQLKGRKPKFPLISLSEAIDKAKKLYEADGAAGSSRDAAYKHLGYGGKNGASVAMLSDLEKYGLTYEQRGRIIPTKDAQLILLKGGDETKRTEAIKRCALNPELFRTLWDTFAKAGNLPSDATLKTELVTEMGISHRMADMVIGDFRKTIKFADLSFNDAKMNVLTSTGETMDFLQSENSTPSGALPKSGGATTVRDYSIPRKWQRTAILKLEYPVSAEDIDQISKWLELMKDTLSDESS